MSNFGSVSSELVSRCSVTLNPKPFWGRDQVLDAGDAEHKALSCEFGGRMLRTNNGPRVVKIAKFLCFIGLSLRSFLWLPLRLVLLSSLLFL